MGFGGFLLTSALAVLALGVWFGSNEFRPREYHLQPPPPLTGPLAPKPLKGLEKLFEGQLLGAESIVIEKNTLYTCLMSGNCVKIVDGKVVKSVPMAARYKNCDGSRETRAYCGRPLGIRRFDSRRFAVADAFLGLFFVDFEKGTADRFLSANVAVDGRPLGFPDDLDFADNDTIIFSDASTRYDINNFIFDFLEHQPTGRLIEYKLSTGTARVLMDGLMFVNGVQMHPDKQSVLFCESGTARVHRFYLTGSKKGRHEVFVDNLPGFPDNIRASASGKSFYVALFGHRDVAGTNFFDRTAGYPMARKILGEFLRLMPETLQFHVLEAFSASHGMFVELDLEGRVIASYHDPSGEVIKHTSQICDDGGKHLLLASYANNYIGRVQKLH